MCKCVDSSSCTIVGHNVPSTTTAVTLAPMTEGSFTPPTSTVSAAVPTQKLIGVSSGKQKGQQGRVIDQLIHTPQQEQLLQKQKQSVEQGKLQQHQQQFQQILQQQQHPQYQLQSYAPQLSYQAHQQQQQQPHVSLQNHPQQQQQEQLRFIPQFPVPTCQPNTQQPQQFQMPAQHMYVSAPMLMSAGMLASSYTPCSTATSASAAGSAGMSTVYMPTFSYSNLGTEAAGNYNNSNNNINISNSNDSDSNKVHAAVPASLPKRDLLFARDSNGRFCSKADSASTAGRGGASTSSSATSSASDSARKTSTADKTPNPKSKYRGVRWYRRTSRWVVQVRINGQRKHVGYFEHEDEAAAAYCTALEKFQREARNAAAAVNSSAAAAASSSSSSSFSSSSSRPIPNSNLVNHTQEGVYYSPGSSTGVYSSIMPNSSGASSTPSSSSSFSSLSAPAPAPVYVFAQSSPAMSGYAGAQQHPNQAQYHTQNVLHSYTFQQQQQQQQQQQ